MVPARLFHLVADGLDDLEDLPSHISHDCAFTWYFLPVATVARIRRLVGPAEFNAVVASVYYDTVFGGLGEEPYNEVPVRVFAAATRPAPAGLAAALNHAEEGPALVHCRAGGAVLVHSRGRFHYVGEAARDSLHRWRAPPGARAAPYADLRLANRGGLCGFCAAPLHGEVYAVEDPLIAPYQLAVCVWCAGCLPAHRRAAAARTAYPRTLAEAFADSPPLLALLEADVEAVRIRPPATGEAGPGYVFRVRPEKGDGFFLEPAGRVVVPACLRHGELRGDRVASLGHPYLAILPEEA